MGRKEAARVALVPCGSYDGETVYQAVKWGVEALGGMAAFVRPEEKVLIKPNLLGKQPPQMAVTTHPAVFAAAARLLRENGCADISYGDSPGNPNATPQSAAEGSGIAEEAERLGVRQGDFDSGSAVRFDGAKQRRSFVLCRGVQEADAVVNVAKMKTHALERITGAMKNLYGCIWGMNKSAGHVRYPNSWVFADMLADLQKCVAPRLHILDGVTAMEGNGPTSGTPTPMNVILVSDDPVALDSVFAMLAYLEPSAVPTCVSGYRAGLGEMRPEHIRVLTPDGELTAAQAQEKYGRADFDVFRGEMKRSLLGKLFPLLPRLQSRPVVDRAKCVACGLCEKACPVPEKAVHSGNGHKARYDYSRCIRCYCCQEMCPAKAIRVQRGRWGGK